MVAHSFSCVAEWLLRALVPTAAHPFNYIAEWLLWALLPLAAMPTATTQQDNKNTCELPQAASSQGFKKREEPMRAIISEKLQAHLQSVGSNVLTITLNPLRC